MPENKQAIHELKLDPDLIDDIYMGDICYQIRYNNRGYKKDDILWLRETQYSADEMAEKMPLKYTGREAMIEVNSLIYGPRYGLKEGWVIMSLDQATPIFRNKHYDPMERAQGNPTLAYWPDGTTTSVHGTALYDFERRQADESV